MNIEDRLVAFARAPITAPEALEMARLSVFDWATCGLAGLDEPVARIVRAAAQSDAGAPLATLIGSGRVPTRAAALVNGTISHALDYDDTHFGHIGHPSVAVVPAALALAETTGAPMEDFIAAVLIGAEASIRVGLWLGRAHYQAGFHQTATAGAIGATVATCRLAGADDRQCMHAIGLAATRAAGLKSQFGTMGKPYNAGLAAETGVVAATLALAGMTSTPLGLSGPQGLGPTHHGVADMAALDGLGDEWSFLGISHKFHACCHGLHAMLGAVQGLAADPAQVVAVIVRTHPRWLSVCNIAAPRTGLEAKFSYRLTCAMALAGVDTGATATFSEAMACRADLAALRDLVSVVADNGLTEMQAAVQVTLRGGAVLTATHDLAVSLPYELRSERLRAKTTALLGAARADDLWAATKADTLSPFVALLGADRGE